MSSKEKITASERKLKEFQAEYDVAFTLVERFCEELVKQIKYLLIGANIRLAVPIEYRIKTWQSSKEKLIRKAVTIKRITDLTDLIGVRIVLLFRRDINTVCELLDKTFEVASKEDTSMRLNENQFGYSSLHYTISLPENWLAIPSLRGLNGLMAEVQVRTAAQHIWAASSHVLQYKQEDDVPPQSKRTIYRISALLETVDLEFERVLEEKNSYIESLDPRNAEPLNVNSLERVLDEIWPQRNKDSLEPEDFSSLLQEIKHFGIEDTSSLRKIIEKQYKKVLAHDAVVASKQADHDFALAPADRARALAGYWFTHVGLTRQSLADEFGDEWKKYRDAKLPRSIRKR